MVSMAACVVLLPGLLLGKVRFSICLSVYCIIKVRGEIS